MRSMNFSIAFKNASARAMMTAPEAFFLFHSPCATDMYSFNGPSEGSDEIYVAASPLESGSSATVGSTCNSSFSSIALGALGAGALVISVEARGLISGDVGGASWSGVV